MKGGEERPEVACYGFLNLCQKPLLCLFFPVLHTMAPPFFRNYLMPAEKTELHLIFLVKLILTVILPPVAIAKHYK